MLISAISNLLIGLLTLFFLIGVIYLILSFYEFRLDRTSDRADPGDFAKSARNLSYFQMALGVFNGVALICGIVVFLNSGKLRDGLRSAREI